MVTISFYDAEKRALFLSDDCHAVADGEDDFFDAVIDVITLLGGDAGDVL